MLVFYYFSDLTLQLLFVLKVMLTSNSMHLLKPDDCRVNILSVIVYNTNARFCKSHLVFVLNLSRTPISYLQPFMPCFC